MVICTAVTVAHKKRWNGFASFYKPSDLMVMKALRSTLSFLMACAAMGRLATFKRASEHNTSDSLVFGNTDHDNDPIPANGPRGRYNGFGQSLI